MAVFECSFEEGLSRFDIAVDKAYADVIASGLSVTQRPTINGKPADRPDMPDSLSELGLVELQNLIGVLTRWHSYAIGQKILAGNQRDAAAEKKSFAWKYIRRLKEGTVSDKDDSAGIDVRYVEVEAQYRYHDSKYGLLAGVVEALKREIETISRAFEALKQRMDSEGRHVGMGRQAAYKVDREERAKKHDALSQVFRRHGGRRA